MGSGLGVLLGELPVPALRRLQLLLHGYHQAGQGGLSVRLMASGSWLAWMRLNKQKGNDIFAGAGGKHCTAAPNHSLSTKLSALASVFVECDYQA